MKGIIDWLSAQGYGTVDDSYYNTIAIWESWYRGKTRFHSYRQYNGIRNVSKTRKSLGMAKKISEDWANLLLNEKFTITVTESAQEQIDRVLADNKFPVRANSLIELTMALGTGAFVEFKDGDKTNIDYIRADMIFPLAWENGEILDCAFASQHKQGKDTYIYLNVHTRNERGNYIVKNAYFTYDGKNLHEASLPEGVVPEYNTGSSTKLFQILRPNIVNNIELDCPMGVSIYANSIDQLEAVDLTYDSYVNEFQLGKKRVIIPLRMARIIEEADGSATPVFDPDDTEFYAVQETDGQNKIVEMNMDIRADAHEQGLKTGLNVLAKKCGLGDTYYRFEGSGVKTATEVVSEQSDLFRNLRKHELVIEEALTDLVKAIAELEGITVNDEDIVIGFDDSIIEDIGAEKERFLQEIRDGVRQKWEYRVKFMGETEEEAKANSATMTETWFEE